MDNPETQNTVLIISEHCVTSPRCQIIVNTIIEHFYINGHIFSYISINNSIFFFDIFCKISKLKTAHTLSIISLQPVSNYGSMNSKTYGNVYRKEISYVFLCYLQCQITNGLVLKLTPLQKFNTLMYIQDFYTIYINKYGYLSCLCFNWVHIRILREWGILKFAIPPYLDYFTNYRVLWSPSPFYSHTM